MSRESGAIHAAELVGCAPLSDVFTDSPSKTFQSLITDLLCTGRNGRATARIANTREEVYVIIESVKTCFRRLEMIVEQDVVCASLVEINNC